MQLYTGLLHTKGSYMGRNRRIPLALSPTLRIDSVLSRSTITCASEVRASATRARSQIYWRFERARRRGVAKNPAGPGVRSLGPR